MCKSNINSWDQFILENKICSLLLEGNLMASQAFIQRLDLIESPISKVLSNAFKNKTFIDKDLTQNWIDMSSKEDTVTFISDRNAKKSEGDEYNAKGRNEIKIGRLLRPILTELGQKFSDKEIEEFVNQFKSKSENNSNAFKVVTGEEIKNAYYEKNYDSLKGTLGGSCMRYDSCQGYFGIYTDNPKQCRLLVYSSPEGKVLGRALLWKIHEANLNEPCDCKYFMDRVYCSKDSDVLKFIEWAKHNNVLYKWKMTADANESLVFKHGDNTVYGQLIIKIDNSEFDEYPFVDTLSHLHKSEGLISNVGFYKTKQKQLLMIDTQGQAESCNNCYGTGYYENNQCNSCDGNGSNDCPDCYGTGNEQCKSCYHGDIVCPTCSEPNSEGRRVPDGNIECKECEGRGDIPCQECSEEGRVNCKKCNGEGNLGKCKKCSGEGHTVCKICKNQPINCKNCNGEGRYRRQWGNGFRTVACKECKGEGKINPDTMYEIKNGDSSKCEGCSETYPRYWAPQYWRNRGIIHCQACDGDGDIPCHDCYGDGMVDCEKCDGRGCNDCEECDGRGSSDCEKCNGSGILGDCKNKRCDSGSVGKCKNKQCSDGQIKCADCKGTGDAPKKQLSYCMDCSGLLIELNKNIKNGSFKLN